jgi:hypothetical protein
MRLETFTGSKSAKLRLVSDAEKHRMTDDANAVVYESIDNQQLRFSP